MKAEYKTHENNDHLLLRLKYYLNYEVSTSVLFAVSFFYFIILILTVVLAVIFMPYLFYVLIKVKKYGWLTAFVIVVIMPTVILVIADINSVYSNTFLLIELGLFYFLCFVLRLTVNDWCEEIKWKLVNKQQKEDKAEKDKVFESFFDT